MTTSTQSPHERLASFTTLASGRAPRIIAGLILLLIVADAARFVWSAGGGAIPEATDPPRLASLRPPVRSALQDVRRVHLFGMAPAAQSAEAVSAAVSANWVLNGTIATNDPDNGYAIIARRPQGDRLWRAGAQISADARLYRVFRDHVLLEVDGQLQTLFLPRGLSGSSLTLVAAAPKVAGDGTGAAPQLPGSGGLLPKETAAQSWLDRVRPFATDGSAGFVVRVPGKNHRLGFEDGDVVTAVNGHPVQDLDSASQLLQQDTSGSLSLTVERDGQPETVDIDLGH